MASKKTVSAEIRKTSEGWLISTKDEILGPYDTAEEAVKVAEKRGWKAKVAGATADRSEAARRAHETRALKGNASEAAAKAWETRKANAETAAKMGKTKARK